ncbi:T9SS type A sorting domain-containing protein [Chryseobacterium camelliae]|uniref:T9SS type A sorting domain-containing protein n=1 Tax=Chryseobacterium camelliae TaxID=1265445 RepID=A0ABY7QJE8_9FLAO|nr:T9SS type A sorting domain-containing protein [Chryseobacterium camelliae]WBV59792.1 T9SS type A sorting domain-containing protein [Chryseobacterium camelliae]
MKRNYFFAKLFAGILTFTLANFFNAQTYCNPTYPSGCSNWRITQVTIPSASFDNTFASGTCTTARDRTSVTVNLSTGTSYTINITTMGWISAGMAIDFNKDGDFNDAGETLFLPGYIANDTQMYTGNFTIPTSVTAGSYRMRIWNRLANSGPGTPADSACGTYAYGTWTDYTAAISTLSTSEVSKVSAKVYPNPVSDLLNIESKNTIESIEIYDINGKLIKTISQKSSSASVRLSDLAPGTYFAKVNDHKTNQTIKFIKK